MKQPAQVLVDLGKRNRLFIQPSLSTCSGPDSVWAQSRHGCYLHKAQGQAYLSGQIRCAYVHAGAQLSSLGQALFWATVPLLSG